MIIRREQLRSFERDATQRFVQRMEKHLRAAFPEQTAIMSPPDLAARVQAAIPIAGKHGLTRERDVESYLNVMCASSADLAGDPPDWIRRLLMDPAIPDEAKSESLYRAYADRQRDG